MSGGYAAEVYGRMVIIITVEWRLGAEVYGWDGDNYHQQASGMKEWREITAAFQWLGPPWAR